MTFIYVILDEETDRVKIGRSIDPQKRLVQLRTGNPTRLKIVAAFGPWPDGVAAAWESYLHEAFKADRIVGEWFEIDPLLVGQTMAQDYEPPAVAPLGSEMDDVIYHTGVVAGSRFVPPTNWPRIPQSEVQL